MNRLWKCCCLLLLGLSLAAPAGAQDSAGNEFVFAVPNNFRGEVDLTLFITGDQDAQGTVEIPGIAFNAAFAVVAGEITEIQLPTEAQQLNFNGITERGVRVVADAQVTVYALNRQQYTTDAFLALPLDTLGNEYVAISYDGLAQFSSSSLSSEVAIVATEDNTLVQIFPAVDAGPNPAGVPFTVTLDALQVYQLNNDTADLTGTIINANAPVAVMGAHRCADVPSISRSPTGGRIGWCDHLVEMVPPVNTWGQSFLSVPLASRVDGSIVRVLAGENGIDVLIGSRPPVTLNRGQFVETVLTDYTSIEATGPVLVAQYSPGQGFDEVAADPFMMLIPPNEQFLQDYTFAVPVEGFGSNFVNVALPTLAADTLVLDGAPVDPALFTAIGASGFSGAQIPLTPGTHTIAAVQAFGIHVYGFNAYDSYGYPGGQALAVLNPTADGYPPSFGALRQIGRTLLGTAADSEDLNANGVLDAGEDLNANGVLDRRTEDLDGNGQLDAGEDVNGNGALDRDRSLFIVELLAGADNLELRVLEYVSGLSPLVNFRLDLVDPTRPGTGTLQVEDLGGNATQLEVVLPTLAALGDVRVTSTVAGDRITVDQASFTRTPVNVDVQPGRTVIEWAFDTISVDEVQDLAFDVTLIDPQAGEQRLVTQSLVLSYINAPFGERITTELGPQSVLIRATVFDIAISAAQANFGPDTIAAFVVDIANVGTAANGGTVGFVIEDTAGNAVAAFAPRAFGPLAAGASTSLDVNWDTGTLLAGPYRLHALVRDADGVLVNEAFEPFSIVNSTAGLPVASVGVVAGVNTDGVFVARDSYHTTDVVQIQARVVNESTNTLVNGAVLRVQVLGPAGQEVFSSATPVNAELGPGAIDTRVTSFLLDDAPPGVYTVRATFENAGDSAIIGAGSTGFTVARDLSLSVSGAVTVAFGELLLGDTQVCTDTVTSLVSGPIDLPVITALVNIASQQEVNSTTTATLIEGGETLVSTRDETTGGVQGDFACVLRADAGSVIRTLGFAVFSVFDVIADPGPDRQALVGQVVQLDATGSRETVNRPLTYRWRLVQRGPGSQAVLSDPGAAQPTFFVDEQGVYVLELIVNNGIEDSLPKRMRVTVPNRLAQAEAGPDQAVGVGDTVQLDGSGSIDLDGDALTFNWVLTQRPAGSQSELSDPGVVNPTLPIDVAGVYLLRLEVNDGLDAGVPDTVLLNVGNVPPVADAGADFLALIGDVITLDGSGSSDVNGDNLSYAWFFDSLPANSGAQLFNNGALRPTFTIDVAGDYVVRLRVSDGLAESDPDLIVIRVGNAPPSADAGPDRSATVGQLVQLDGTGSMDQNGDTLTYRWNLLARPVGSNAQLQNPLTATPRFLLDVQGDYLLQLIVNDGEFDSGPDTTIVTVGNLRPIADAMFDEPGELFTGDLVTLDGSGSFDPEGGPLVYRWEFVQRPEDSNAFLANADTATPSFTIDRQGAYVAQLVVSDGQLDSAPDSALVEGAMTCLANLAIRPKYNKVQLTWDYNPDTELVEVERSLSLDGPYAVVGETDSTYSTFLDGPVTPNTRYYYRIRGMFPTRQLTECRDVGEGLSCGGELGFCSFEFGEEGFETDVVNCQDGSMCDVIEFGPGREVFIDCGGGGGGGGANSCPPFDFTCQLVCGECGTNRSCIDNFNEGSEVQVDPELCEVASARAECSTQVIATVPVYRVRLGLVPDVSGLSVDEADAVLTQNRFVLGEITYERTTAVPPGEVIRQDAPRQSVMPLNTPVDVVVSTRGVP